MADRKGLSAPIPTQRPREDHGVAERRSAVSTAIPVEKGQLCLEGAGSTWALTGTRLLLGRAGGGVGADVELADDSVSRRHAELLATPEGWQLRDLGSVNGTVVDGEALKAGEAVIVAEGQVVRFGAAELRVVSR